MLKIVSIDGCEPCLEAERILRDEKIEFVKVDGLKLLDEMGEGVANFPTFINGDSRLEGLPVDKEVLIRFARQKS